MDLHRCEGNGSLVLYLDGDVVALTDHLERSLVQPYEQQRGWDIVCQCDENIGNDKACAADARRGVELCPNMCTGVMLLRNSARLRCMLEYDRHVPIAVLNGFDNNDQTYINMCYNQGALVCLTFPRHVCPNGLFASAIPAGAALLHYNFMVGPEKRSNMQRNKHWLAAADGQPLAESDSASRQKA
jgi:hypothetical protein